MGNGRGAWTGRDLAAERTRQGLRQSDVATALGVSDSRIAAVEATWRPGPEIVLRYLAALGLTAERRLERAALEMASAVDDLP